MATFETFDALLNETLGDLEKKGAEDERKNKRGGKNNKNRGGKGKDKPSSSAPEKEPIQKKTEYNLDLPELSLEPDEDYEIKPEREEQEITNPVTFEETHKKIGEEVSGEYVEQLMEDTGMPEDGHKATVIIHTRTVTDAPEKGILPDNFEIKEEAPNEEDAEAELLRQIKESEQGEGKEMPKRPKVSLTRKDTGEVYELTQKRTTIGRESENDIVIEEPAGKYISGHHATIEIESKGKVKIREREGGTTNGTFVNKNKIGSRYIKDGDIIKLGNFELVLSID